METGAWDEVDAASDLGHAEAGLFPRKQPQHCRRSGHRRRSTTRGRFFGVVYRHDHAIPLPEVANKCPSHSIKATILMFD